MSDRSPGTTVVVGASRGLGRGIATAFGAAEAPVVAVAVARSAAALSTLAAERGRVEVEVADATVLARHDPSTVVVVAGASPTMRPLQDQTWETVSANWHTEV